MLRFCLQLCHALYQLISVFVVADALIFWLHFALSSYLRIQKVPEAVNASNTEASKTTLWSNLMIVTLSPYRMTGFTGVQFN